MPTSSVCDRIARWSTVGLALFALSACGIERNPPGPGGGGSGGGGEGDVDAGEPSVDGGAPTQISGDLCAIDDLRTPEICTESIDLGDVDIEVVGGGTTTADPGGEFVVAAASDSTRQLLLIGFESLDVRAGLVPVVVNDDGTTVDVPVVPQQTWNDVVAATSAAEPDGMASILTYLVDEEVAVVGADVTPPSGTVSPPFYDAGGPLSWSQGTASGDFGTVLLFGVPADQDTVSFTVNDPIARRNVDVEGIPVVPDGLTIITVDLSQ